jgi:hypothetical protein
MGAPFGEKLCGGMAGVFVCRRRVSVCEWLGEGGKEGREGENRRTIAPEVFEGVDTEVTDGWPDEDEVAVAH